MKSASLMVVVLLMVSALAAEDGKVYVKSDPAGAEIGLLGSNKEVFTSLGKTPLLVNLPKGDQKLVLKLAGYKDAHLDLKVDGTAIMKPDPVKLSLATASLDILYSQEGWTVLVDKKAVNDVSGKPAVAPCTIDLPQGHHEVELVKDGFSDMVTQVVVGGDMALDVDKAGLKATKGKSTLLSKPISLPQQAQALSGEIVILANEFKTASSPKMTRAAKEFSGLTMNWGMDAWAEWEVNLHAGKYYFHTNYTSDGPRPLDLLINGTKQGPIMDQSSGSFQADGLRWDTYGPYEFADGLNKIRLQTSREFPHMKGFVISTSDKTPTGEKFKKK